MGSIDVGGASAASADEYERYLQEKQYSRRGVLKYEAIFGSGFISTGGLETTREITKHMQLKPGQRVLDVGCGIGGGDSFIHETYGADVLGIDLTSTCIDIAQERYKGTPSGQLEFRKADVMTLELPASSVDVIYSRDAILHIEPKLALFRRFCEWLKPGGRVVITDYCCGGPPHTWTEEFRSYIADRQYFLLTVDEYARVLQQAGLTVETSRDMSADFTSVLTRELALLEGKREAFFAEGFSQADYDDLREGWQKKLDRVAAGVQTWGLFVATKPH
ncbi:unnamed protein product [Vitrella brassicaformis CCMP3155]|uniref:phosphoethanolamine N-methyltransferase n=1 Tax=Vitrella brassicaformis (strain CCMP3155) TaxID=1169540 RepID=A0A0G4G8I1_VITBC|nr:unnamed protein product [Vitrella brassicaformis CCMP3155]|mmetsp:Transcript_26580/g.66087  ORF Transcript_26580/g.66087 Transcript_26580/m.66087 type:complete len:277 (-) Transcript_26580:749-1579(-)|eukprot:CEM25187.1 unnamed protein product [Vitrella brassicaformis CCMP3155]